MLSTTPITSSTRTLFIIRTLLYASGRNNSHLQFAGSQEIVRSVRGERCRHSRAQCTPRRQSRRQIAGGYILWFRRGCARIALTGDPHDWFEVVADSGVESPLADAQGPALRQRVLLRHPPARAGRARGRARVQQAGGAARPPREARDPRVPAVHRADARLARRRRVRAFHAEHRDIVLKPLDGMGGMGIFRVGPTA